MFERNGLLLQRKFRDFLLPSILMSAAASLAAMVDCVIVGHLLGEVALSVIGLTGPIVYCLNTVYLLVAVGGVACAAVAKGQRDTRRADVFFTLAIAFGLLAMLLLVAGLLAFMTPVADALAGGNAELAALTRAYGAPLVLVGPVMMLIMGVALFVRSDGSPRIAARIAIVANVVNLILDYVFIKHLDMGIAGAAWSTVIGYCVGVFMLAPYFFSPNRGYHFVRVGARDLGALLSLLRVGLPKGLSPGLSFLRLLFLNALITAHLGQLGLTAMTVCMNTLAIAAILIAGTGDTLLPLAATLYGEMDYAGIRYAVRSCLGTLIPACVGLALLFIALPGSVARLIGVGTPEGLAAAIPAVRMYALSLPFFGLNTLLQNFYQSTGREKLAALIACLNGFALVVPIAYALTLADPGLIWLCFVLAEAATLGCVVLAAGLARRREKVSGMLLLRRNDSGPALDITVPATAEGAAGLGQRVGDFCRANGVDASVANRMAVALEEMAANVARHGGGGDGSGIDVVLRRGDDKLAACLRDGGLPFDPTTYRPGERDEYEIGGIEVVRRIADKVEYSHPMGFNSTVITISIGNL